MAVGVEISGIPQLQKRLKELEASLYEAEMQTVFTSAASVLASSARSRAPRGRHGTFTTPQGYQVYPGRLKKAIRSGAFKPGAVRRYGPGAYAQVNLKVRYGTTAPYGHIVESGRKSTRPFVGRWYFRQTVESIGVIELNKIAAKAKRVFDRRINA